MAKRLTLKQREFVANYIKLKNGTKAALIAYDADNENVASVIATENLGKPNIQQAIETAMVKMNLTPERAVKPIDEALNHEDLEMRLKGSDRALKLMGVGKDGGTKVNINFNNVANKDRDEFGL